MNISSAFCVIKHEIWSSNGDDFGSGEIMDEFEEAQLVIQAHLGRDIETSEISQESVVLRRDELDPAMLSPVVISTLSEWVIVDMFAVHGQAGDTMVCFIRSADGTGDPLIEGLILNNRQVIWTKMLD